MKKDNFIIFLSSLFLFLSVIKLHGEQLELINKKVVFFPITETKLAPLVNSFILKNKKRTGETFKRGEVLVVLYNKLYKAMYIKAKAELKGARETYQFAMKVYEYNKTLFPKGAIGEQELDESKLKMINALVRKTEAEANLSVAKIKLDSCEIRAPFSGRVIDNLKDNFDYIREGEPIIDIANDNLLLAVFNIPSDKINNIKIGDEVKFKVDETGEIVAGKIYSIAGSIDPASRTIEIKAIINNKNKSIRLGMSGLLVSNI